MNSIVIKDITYRYPMTEQNALDGITYTFQQGKFYGIIGPNGSGKSTLCSLIKGLVPSFYLGDLTGEIEIMGKNLADWDLDVLTTKIGYIFQNPFTQISGIKDTVFEEIAIGLENLGTPKEIIIQKVIEIVKLIGIEDLLPLNPNELSGGQRQRVAFAAILAMDAEIYVIDEPTSQLDPEGTESVFRIIKMLKDAHKTIILVEHKVDLLAKYADEILVMKDGKILICGTTHEVLSDYALLAQGVMLPQTVLLAHDLAEAGKALDEIPITLECAQQILERRRVQP